MIVIAIVGILAAIALPAYQDYTVRAKMSEALAGLAEAKTTITEYYAANNSLPTVTAAGINTDPDTDIVASIVYTSITRQPLLVAIVKQAVLPGATANQHFVLSGNTTDGNRISWKCKPTAAALTGVTNPGSAIAIKYLPANCRG
jgi:type IV pilus assembly protein PilA